MKKIFIGLLVIALFIFGALAYIGVIPVISPLFNKPRDLGVVSDPKLIYDFEKKYGANAVDGKIYLDVQLTDKEITSVFAVWELRDKQYPLKNVQVRLHPDGTGEASGILRLPVAVSLAKQLGYSDSDIEKGKQYVQFVAGDLPFYVKGKGGMKSNQIAIQPAELQIGRINVPPGIVSPLTSLVGDMIDRRIQQIGGADIIDANFSDGTFHLKGTVPATIKY